MKDELLRVRCSSQQMGNWKDAADEAGLTLSQWVTAQLDAAAHVPDPDPERVVVDGKRTYAPDWRHK